MRTIGIVALVAGCTSGKDTGEALCDIAIASRVPEAGAAHYYRAAIEWELEDPDPTATVVTDIPGAQTTSDDGRWVRWEPTSPLTPSSPYTATLEWCGGTDTVDFSTSTTGTAVADPVALVGRTFALALGTGRAVSPPGLGEVLTDELTTQILVGVQAVSTAEIDLVGAISTEFSNPPEQNYCNANVDFAAVDWAEAPYFAVGPADVTLQVAGAVIDVFGLEVSGAFTPDGLAIDGATFRGLLDTRPLAPLMSDTGSLDAICELAINFGTACEVCPSDGETYCIDLRVDQLVGELVDGLTLAEVPAADCPGCLEGPPDLATCG